MKKLSILFCLLACIACKKETEEKLPVFYTYEAMIARRKLQKDSTLPPPPPPISQHYSIHNFIVDSIGGLYYFQHDIPLLSGGCGTGYTEDSYPAKFINLTPERLIKIPSQEIEKFVKRKILTDTVADNLVFIPIGSKKDTFYSADLLKVDKLLDKKVRLFMSRHITQEESEVLYHKEKGLPYDYNLIKWDSVRTTFHKYH